MIYLDYQATTPLAPEALQAMLPWLTPEASANPHASHVSGRAAKAAVEVAREQVASMLPSGGRVIFTSGATEAANWALKGVDATGCIVLPQTEHACVRDTALWLQARGRDVSLIPVDAEGRVPETDLPPGTALVATMLVNNEIGVIQPVKAIADAAHKAGSLMFCDAVQGYGRTRIPDECDLVAISAHKIHGPKGIGALWVRAGVELEPLMHGGGQEFGMRSGTLSPALCAGFGAAAALAHSRWQADAKHVENLWNVTWECLGTDWILNGSPEHRYKGNLNIRRHGLDAARLISDLRGVALSAGSACASGSGRPSHVLRALGLSTAEARSSIRIGYGRYTREDELREALSQIVEAADRQLDLAT